MIVQNRVKELREVYKMSREELARKAEVSVSHLTHVENHTKPLNIPLAIRISKAFNMKFKDIFL